MVSFILGRIIKIRLEKLKIGAYHTMITGVEREALKKQIVDDLPPFTEGLKSFFQQVMNNILTDKQLWEVHTSLERFRSDRGY